MHFVGRLRRELRRKVNRFVWGKVGFATSVLALGRWPEWFSDVLVGLHEHAYYKWADTRDFTPRCYVCTQPIVEEVVIVGRDPLAAPSAIFCSPECRTKFEEHVRRSRRVMPSPVGDALREMDAKVSS